MVLRTIVADKNGAVEQGGLKTRPEPFTSAG